MIPAEAVEAAAAHMHDDEGYFETFADAPDFRKEHFREKATGILEAAAPHMLREAWESGWANARGNYLTLHQGQEIPDWVTLRNPYGDAK